MNTLSPTVRHQARESHVCAFCRGKGVDPYNAMSELSTCGSCGGKGTLQVPTPHIPCAYCSASGSIKTYRCLICGGAGVVAAPTGPTRTCPDCDGKAREQSSGLACLTCKGRGFVPE
jgi:DnaJ-class molecular chaperone